MWGNDGRGSPLPSAFGMSRQGWQAGRRARDESDTLTPHQEPEEEPGARAAYPAHLVLPDVMELEGDDADDVRMDFPGGAAQMDTPAWRRLRARRAIREFLRTMPRTESNEAVTFLRPDGEPRTVTRGELAAAVDRMRPRMRRIIQQAVEAHCPRRIVCEQMGISIKTYERDYMEALDILLAL